MALPWLCVVAASVANAETLTGRVVYAPCWNRVDRSEVPYGGREDLECSIDSAKRGLGPSLAVPTEQGYELVALAGTPPDDGTWLDWVGRLVGVEGRIERGEGEVTLVVGSLEASEAAPWSEPVASLDEDGERLEMHWTDLAGRPTSLGDRRRIVVLTFWATWCEPCIGEWPDLIRLHDKFAPYGVEFIGAAADQPDQIELVRDYVRRYEIDFPVVLGATVEQMQSVGLRPALPGTAVLTERGYPFDRDQYVINPLRVDAVLSRMLGIEEKETNP